MIEINLSVSQTGPLSAKEAMVRKVMVLVAIPARGPASDLVVAIY